MARGIDALLGEVLRGSHQLAPLEIGPAVAVKLEQLGFTDLAIYVADPEQRNLVPLPPATDRAPLGIDATLAGRVYQRSVWAREHRDPTRAWFPLRDGVDRLGVLLLAHDDFTDDLLVGCESVASLVALLLISKGQFTDDFELARRQAPMTLGAELCWSLLPPLSFSTETISVSAALEPAYRVSGDSFDYAFDGQTLHVAVFDGMGHDLDAARLTDLMVSGYRHCRRRGLALPESYRVLDQLLRDTFGNERFVTAQFVTLDTVTGSLELLNAGHPGPLVVRDRHVIDLRSDHPAFPLGLGDLDGAEPEPRTHSLQPDDRLLFYTDGLTEARAADGSLFGQERLIETVEAARNDTHVLAEALRRLMHTLGAFGDDDWHDDATLVMVHWTPRRDESSKGGRT